MTRQSFASKSFGGLARDGASEHPHTLLCVQDCQEVLEEMESMGEERGVGTSVIHGIFPRILDGP